jgi:endogenous inhibitor of DNA gyrase (YacG/DUF329 family)
MKCPSCGHTVEIEIKGNHCPECGETVLNNEESDEFLVKIRKVRDEITSKHIL